jgi:hypothetical protein
MLAAIVLTAMVAGGFAPSRAQKPSDICSDVSDCRAQALAARAAGDYEHFHDLAWRAVQKGKPNDPHLMYLLARAQSLSGRPDDALVMLGRLADQGVAADVETNPDFERVRAMSTWPELEARLRAMGPSTLSSPDEASAGAASAPSPPSPPPPVLAPAAPPPAPPVAAVDAAPPPETPSPSSAATPASSPAPVPDFDPSDIAPIGLAHDAVSRRFVMGDRNSARLVIVDDLSHHVVTLVSAASAGFFDHVTGFTIDTRRGDLWVTSTRDEGSVAASRLHKLQLVSGRVLEQVDAPPAAKLVDVAVAPDGTVYALDGAGLRLLRLKPGAKEMDGVMPIAAGVPLAIAAAGDRELYVATSAAIVRLDPIARRASLIKSAVALTGIQSLAWRPGALIAVRHQDSASALIVLPLDASGERASRPRVLAAAADDSPVAVAGRTVYFLSAPGVIAHVDVK